MSTARPVSVHAPVLDALASPCRGTVLSVFDRAANVALESGAMLCVVHPALGNGPGAILLPGPWPLPWSPGDALTATGGALTGPGLSVATAGAPAWTPPPPPAPAPRPDPAPGLAALRAAGSAAGALPAVLAALGEPVARPPGAAGALFDLLGAGIAALTAGDWPTAVRRLAGLGPGLTPSGDDLLAGFACLLARAGHAAPDLHNPNTTELSRHLLTWAARGVAGEHHLAFADALLTGADPGPALAPLLTHGATSGADWAAGALLGLHTLICSHIPIEKG